MHPCFRRFAPSASPTLVDRPPGVVQAGGPSEGAREMPTGPDQEGAPPAEESIPATPPNTGRETNPGASVHVTSRHPGRGGGGGGSISGLDTLARDDRAWAMARGLLPAGEMRLRMPDLLIAGCVCSCVCLCATGSLGLFDYLNFMDLDAQIRALEPQANKPPTDQQPGT
jgi:hypothetical protein